MKYTNLYCALALGVSLFVVSACASPPPLMIDDLKNAEYQSEFTTSKKAKLTNGAYQEEIAPGAASKLSITMLDQYALGDLNADGLADAAVFLATNSGGSGVFVNLAAVVSDQGKPRHVASVALGDRVQIKSVTIAAGEIVIDLIRQGPNDPLCCPTQRLSQKYKLQDGNLVERK